MIVNVIGRQILDSRGNPTVEVDILLESGVIGRAAVPSGASTGKREALELRDGEKNFYMGKSVGKAIENINEIIGPAIIGQESSKQIMIDNIMLNLDGTDNKSRFGANAILGVSLAAARASAKELEMPLYSYIGGAGARVMPVPMMNILNGGSHADNTVDIQEFMVMPIGAECFSDALRMGVEIFHNLKKVLKKAGHVTSVGDEGGFAPNLASNEEAMESIMEAISQSGYKAGKDVFIALDVAASELFKDGKYILEAEKEPVFDAARLIEFYAKWVEKYPLFSIEDGMAEDDWDGWKLLTDKLGKRIQIVGDDLFVTNPKIIKKGIQKGVANAVLIKLNQIGTLTETLDAIELTHKAGFKAVVSHRSGETEDSFIADLAVAMNTGQIKTGSASRSDRLAKYNQLLRIEEKLGDSAVYAGIELSEMIK